jgi:hypothetical protein
MARTTTKSTGIVRSLDADSTDLPYPAQLAAFPLNPPTFTPEKGQPNEADGAPLSKLGRIFRETIASKQDVDPASIDLGMVRHFEAMNADTDRNIQALSRPVMRRTGLGVLWSVQVVVHTPMLSPWLINGRALRRLAAKIHGETEMVTSAHDHTTLALPVMDVADADQVVDLVGAQRQLLQLDNYKSTTPQGKLIDSIAVNGVLDAPDVVYTELHSNSGSCWTAQTIEGTQRLFASQHILDLFTGRDVAGVMTTRWFETGLRDLTPADLKVLPEQLTFPETQVAAKGYFPGKDPRTWLETTATTDPEAVSWQLVRTMTINLVIAVEPNDRTFETHPQHPVAAVIQELIRAYHVTGKAKSMWLPGDVDGVAAITIVDLFREQKRIEDWRRAVWLGQQPTSYANPADGKNKDANKLYETVRLIAALTVTGASDADGAGLNLGEVDKVIKDNGMRVHSNERAQVATSQAVMVLGLWESGDENQVAAALQATFRDAVFWKAQTHPSLWTDAVDVPLVVLRDKAHAELAALGYDADPTVDAGPHQRALAALGITALIVNPALLAEKSAVSRTGRGGGGKAVNVSAADPSSLVKKMMMSPRGLTQLYNAVVALVAANTPTVPRDAEDAKFELTDFALRRHWLGLEKDSGTEESPLERYQRLLRGMVDMQEEMVETAEWLRQVTASSILEEDPDGAGDAGDGDEDEDEDDDAETGGRDDDDKLFEVVGIEPGLAKRARVALGELDDFFVTGKALGEAASRFRR